MLKITIKGCELWDERNNEFVTIPETVLALEHSLVSISKWEAKYHKPYLARNKNDTKTSDEILFYIKCMTLTQNVPDVVYLGLTKKNFDEIREYIEDPMTATTVSNNRRGPTSNKIVTSEIIYYWMISYGIPVEFQKWHLNRLLMLIQVCDAYNNAGSGKKMSARELASRNSALNAARRKQINSRG